MCLRVTQAADHRISFIYSRLYLIFWASISLTDFQSEIYPKHMEGGYGHVTMLFIHYIASDTIDHTVQARLAQRTIAYWKAVLYYSPFFPI